MLVLCWVRTDRFPAFYILVLWSVRMKKFQPFQNSAKVSSENNMKAHMAMVCILGPFGWVDWACG